MLKNNEWSMNLREYNNKHVGKYLSTKRYFDFLTAIYAFKYYNKPNITEEHYNETINKWKHALHQKNIYRLETNHERIESVLKMKLLVFTPSFALSSKFRGEDHKPSQEKKPKPVYSLIMNQDSMFKPMIKEPKWKKIETTDNKSTPIEK